MKFQTALRLVYPPRCLACGGMVDSDFGLCGPCWRDTPFIGGLSCDLCGVSLPGELGDSPEICDDCLTTARPWRQGRAALLYKDGGRKLVLALKHGDRHDIVQPAALWMMRAAHDMLQHGMLVAPIPLHWTRLLRRRFNQSALLAQTLARQSGLAYCPDILIRHKRTALLGGMGKDQRFATLAASMSVHPRRGKRMKDAKVLLIDDVMTSGATFAAASEACLRAGASEVNILTLARVAKDA